MMLASRYNVTVPCPDGGTILYSQMSGALVVLDDARLAEYRDVARPGGAGPFRDMLLRAGFLAAGDERDAIADRWRSVTSATARKALTVVPTDRCNLGCEYCYEEKRSWGLMSDAVQEKVKAFVRRLVDATPTRQLAVTWFGGEPTLHMRCIESLSGSFIAACSARGIAYAPFLVTNGTTLGDRMLDRLAACRIMRMQVTVDGLAADHDAKRPFLRDVASPNEAQKAQLARVGLPILGQAAPVHRRSSFAAIMAGVVRARERGFEVKVRMNVDRTNLAGVRSLFLKLRDEGLLERHASGGAIMAYSSPIFDGCGGCSPGQLTKAEHAAFEAGLRAEGLAQDSWRFRDLRFTGATCTANMDFDFIVNQDGVLTKCWHHAADGLHAIGTVDDLHLAGAGTRAADPLAFDPLADGECRECRVLPLCMGGCKANNKFPDRGYAGPKDAGCHAVRFALEDHVLEVYRLRKAENAARP